MSDSENTSQETIEENSGPSDPSCFSSNCNAVINDINKDTQIDNYDIVCRPYGRQKLLSACVSIWAEVHKICKA